MCVLCVCARARACVYVSVKRCSEASALIQCAHVSVSVCALCLIQESDQLKKLRLQATAHNLNQELGDNWGAVPVEFKIRYHDHMYER